MVVNAKQAEHILMQANVLAGLGDNGVVCLMSTCPSSDVQRFHKLVADQNLRFVDAPVSGGGDGAKVVRSEEHTSELTSLMRIWYAVFSLTKKKINIKKKDKYI